MDLTLYAGDSRNLKISVTDENSVPINLTGATIKWILTDQGSVKLSKVISSGITISNPTQGEFTVLLTASNTKTLSGTYQQMVRVTTADGNSSIVMTGSITIKESLI